MKKLIFLLLLLPALVNAQSWELSGARTPHRSVTNGASFLGKGAGTIESPLQWDVSIIQPDTSAWQFVSTGSDGKYRIMKNRSTFLGKSAGTVYIQLVYGVTDSALATQNWVKNNTPYGNIITTYLANDTITAANVYVRYDSQGDSDIMFLNPNIQAGWQAIIINTNPSKVFTIDFNGVSTLIDTANFYVINVNTTVKMFYDGTYIIIESEKSL